MSETLQGQEVIIGGVKRQVGMFPIVSLGQTSGGLLIPVLVAADGSISTGLPTGAATSAKQDTQITAEQAILAKLPTLGTTRTPTSATTTSASTTITTGKKSVTIVLGNTFAGTIQGDPYSGVPADDLSTSVVEFEAPTGDVLGVITITRSAGSYRIITVP